MATTYKKKQGCVIAAVAIVLGVAVVRPAAPQSSERLTVDVHDCLSIEKRDERLACFEAQVDAAQRAAPAPGSEPAAPSAAAPASAASAAGAIPAGSAPPAASTAAAASTAVTAESRKPAERRSDEAPSRAKSGSEQASADIISTIAELRETVPNAYVITLDNGQVWRQSPPMAYPLRPGMQVRLRQTKFGYRLTAPVLRGQIQVERVR